MAKKSPRINSPTTASGPRNFVQIADDYARSVVADKKGAFTGKLIRSAAKRYLADRKRAATKACAFVFDEWHAADPCSFIEKLPYVEGTWDTEEMVLHPSQIWFLVQLFGFRSRKNGARRFTSALLAVARKNGKALALDTPVPTPTGWTTMGELEVGQEVLGSDGKPTRVTSTSPIYSDHDCYKLTFSNDEEVVADAGHRWLTRARVDQPDGQRVGNRQTRVRVRTTEEIVQSLRYGKRGDVNHSLEMPSALELDSRPLPVGPYTLGAWLGDGTSVSATITLDREDGEILDAIRSEGYPFRKRNDSHGRASLFALSSGDRSQKARDDGLQTSLRRMGVLGNKHVPADYLRASYAQRLALLQGLMDTDGTVSKSGRVLSIVSVNETLANGIAELLSTFGVKYSIRKNPLVCNGRPVKGTAYQIQFMAFRDELPCFKLSRKLNRMRYSNPDKKARSQSVQIVAAEKVESVPVRCITVDAPDHLFLFGRTMLPTHNSSLAAAILLYCLCCEDEPGAQIVSAATTYDQASIILKIAQKIAHRSPEMVDAFGLKVMAKVITRLEIGASFKAVHAKASTQDGLNPSHTGLDEIHAHKTADLLNVLQSAAGARRSPLWLFTTTEGYENPGPWADIRRYAKQLLTGVLDLTDHDHFLVAFYAVDDEDKEFDPKCWPKANPLWDVSEPLRDAIAKEAAEAKQMPGKLGEFKIKRLNRPAAAAHAWVDVMRWKACNGPVDLEKLRGQPCWGGLDLASTSDLTSFRLTWLVDGEYFTHAWRWVPSTAVAQRTERGTTPYAAWVAAGHLKQTEGNVTDYSVVRTDIKAVLEEFRPAKVGFDTWNAQTLVNQLVEDDVPGVEFVQFIQGTRSYHPAVQAAEAAYMGGKLSHGGDPVLAWCAANVVMKQDDNLNNAPSKKRSAEKIDDFCAFLMSLGVGLENGKPPKEYRMLIV